MPTMQIQTRTTKQNDSNGDENQEAEDNDNDESNDGGDDENNNEEKDDIDEGSNEENPKNDSDDRNDEDYATDEQKVDSVAQEEDDIIGDASAGSGTVSDTLIHHLEGASVTTGIVPTAKSLGASVSGRLGGLLPSTKFQVDPFDPSLPPGSIAPPQLGPP